MSPGELQRARDVFLAVIDLPDDERRAEVRRLCAGDPDLVAEVCELLAYDAPQGSPGPGSEPRAWRPEPHEVASGRDSDDDAESQWPVVPAPGVRVGRYTVLDEIGRGGMGVVCAAYDPTLDRKVALKLVRSAAPTGAQELLERDARLLREAQGLARLSHPSVVTVYDSGIWRGRLYIAMDFIEGRHLRQWLDEETPTLAERLRVLRAAGRGLAAAHDAGLLHRDFKPENLMIGPGDRVRVVDFGLVRPLQAVATPPSSAGDQGAQGCATDGAADSGAESAEDSALDRPLTRAGTVIGTPAFIAPEVLRGEPVDARSDQFSFCVTLFEAIYGRLPSGAQGSLDSLRRTYAGQLDAPAASGPTGRVPAWLRAVLERGLGADPEGRFDDMHQLLDALGRGSRSRGRTLLAIAALVVLAATGVGWAWRQSVRRDAMCRGEDRMVEVWNSATASALREPRPEDPGWRASTRNAIVELLDGYAVRWVSAYREACEATHLRGEQSAELLDLRMACLEQRRREVAALARLLASPGTVTLESALEAAGSLSSLADCRDLVALRAATPRPPGEASRKRIDEARAELAEARVRRLAVDQEAAKASLQDATEIAESVGWQPLIAEVRQEAGWLADTDSRYDEARERFLEALRAALAGRHDRLAVRSLVGLAWIDGYRREDVGQGGDWQALAMALLPRLAERQELEHDLGVAAGALAFAAGDVQAAAESWRSELDWHRQTLGEAHPQTLDLMLRLAGALDALGRSDEALGLVAEQRSLIVNHLGSGHPLLGYNSAQRGNIHFRLGQLAQAEADFRQAVRVLSAAYGRGHARTITALNNLAWVLFRAGQTDEGLALQEEVLALQINLWHGVHSDVALAYGNLAEMHLSLGHGERAIEMAERGLAVMRQVAGDDLQQLVGPASVLGYTLFESGRPRHAIGPLEESLRLGEGRMEPQRLAGARFLLARAYRAAGLDPAHAILLAQAARHDAEAGGQEALVAAIDDWLSGEETPVGDRRH